MLASSMSAPESRSGDPQRSGHYKVTEPLTRVLVVQMPLAWRGMKAMAMGFLRQRTLSFPESHAQGVIAVFGQGFG